MRVRTATVTDGNGDRRRHLSAFSPKIKSNWLPARPAGLCTRSCVEMFGSSEMKQRHSGGSAASRVALSVVIQPFVVAFFLFFGRGWESARTLMAPKEQLWSSRPALFQDVFPRASWLQCGKKNLPVVKPFPAAAERQRRSGRTPASADAHAHPEQLICPSETQSFFFFLSLKRAVFATTMVKCWKSSLISG